MPGDPQPHYVIFEHGAQDDFYVVFVESGTMYTAKYRLAGDDTTPKRLAFRWGYGWFDFSEARAVDVWELEDGSRWTRLPQNNVPAPVVGASFAVEYYDVGPPSEPLNRRHLYVNGSGSNTGDAAGSAECYLVYGSQSQLIEGPYLDVSVSPGQTLSVSGDVPFSKRLDDYESGGVECRARQPLTLFL